MPDVYFRAIDELEETGKITVDHKGEMLLISENKSADNQPLDALSKGEMKMIESIGAKWKDKKPRRLLILPTTSCRIKFASRMRLFRMS